MRLWSEVMVASESDDFVDSIGCTLQDEGAVVVCVGTMDDAVQVLDSGFRPEVLVVDGAMRSGPELVARVRRRPGCRQIPVVVSAPVRDLGGLPSRGVTIVKRQAALVEAIQGLYFGSA
jgi:CheY-like chemotaxis protein